MLLYDIMDYIKDCIDADEDLPEGIDVIEAYKYSHKVKGNEIQAMIIDHSEYERFTTFEDGKIFISPLQFNCYGKQCTIGNEVVSAQKCAYILAQKVISWLNTKSLNDALGNILSAKNGTYTASMPLQDVGTVVYCSVVRIDLYLQNIIDTYPEPDEGDGNND